jgi:hypothetical protein
MGTSDSLNPLSASISEKAIVKAWIRNLNGRKS